MLKLPLDLTDYPRDPRSRPADASLPPGLYVYVQAANGVVWVLPDGPYLHPRILGEREPAMYAGDMSIRLGRVSNLTNLSATFLFDQPAGLIEVARQLARQGLQVESGAVRFFDCDGRQLPRIMQ